MNAALAPELVAFAATLDDRAGRLEAGAEMLAAHAASAAWAGPAADRFRAETELRRQQIRQGAAGLRAAAERARLLASAALA